MDSSSASRVGEGEPNPEGSEHLINGGIRELASIATSQLPNFSVTK